ncbi:hypothetical protein J6590_044677 [Homalodisca vitripennis]|nr:hypothetical protein J6590_044677 [Homalodisca vitripennis]
MRKHPVKENLGRHFRWEVPTKKSLHLASISDLSTNYVLSRSPSSPPTVHNTAIQLTVVERWKRGGNNEAVATLRGYQHDPALLSPRSDVCALLSKPHKTSIILFAT